MVRNVQLSRLDALWYNSSSRAYKYVIEISNDDSTYYTVTDKSNNSTYGDTLDKISGKARYVRVKIFGSSSSDAWASVYEFKVYKSW